MKQLSKRILAYVLAAALLVTCGISGLVLPAAAATTILTENFEGATTNSAIKNWTASGVGTVTADPTNAENKVLKFETAFTNKWSGGKFGLRPSKLYVLKLRAYGGDVVVNFNAGTSKGISAPVANKAYNQTAWQELAYLFETHATTANDAYSIKLNAAANTYIDDIELIELGDAEPENLLVDGSFDLPVSYEYNGYWKDLFTGGATLVDAPGEAGNKAVLLPASTGNRSSKYYGAAVYPAWEKGATYELSMRVYGAPVEFYLNADKGVTEGQGWHSFAPTDATSWQTFKHTFTFSESKASNDSFVFSIAIGKGSSGAYIDDICITKKVAEDATAITLNKTALSLAVGGEETLTVTPVPENGVTETVQWSSSNEAAATVDQTGKITAVAPGTATITATAGALTASCEVTVITAATGLALSETALHLAAGASKTVLATAVPAGAAIGTLSWSSNNEAVATVVNGKITAVANGEATVTVTAGTLSAQVAVTVSELGEILSGGDFENEDWNVPYWTAQLIKDGAGVIVEEADGNHVLQLKPSTNALYFAPAPVKGNTAYVLTFKVKGGAVRTSISATHSASGTGNTTYTAPAGEWGTVTRIFTTKASPNKNYALAIGATTATPTYIDDVSLKALPAATALQLDITAATVNHNDTQQLTVSTVPENANAGTLSWSSSNEAVATVDQTGKVTAIASGEATITVTNGTLSATCVISVPLIAEAFTLKEQSLHFAPGTYKTLTVVTDGNLSAGPLTWASSDAAIVTVDNGKLTAVANGEATVTATNYKGVTASVTVKVDAYGQALSGGDFENGDWNHSTLTNNIIKDGVGTVITEADGNSVLKLPAAVTSTLYFAPAPIKANKTYVVTLKAKGKSLRTHVIAKHIAAGDIGERNFALKADEWTNVQFVFTTNGDPNRSYAVGISNKSGEDILIDDIVWAELPDATELVVTPAAVELLPNGTSVLKVTTVPALANMGAITWTSSNPALVSVDANGNVTALGNEGSVTVTATNDKGIFATATVTINPYANLLTNGDFELGNTLYYNDSADLSALIKNGVGKDGGYGLVIQNASGSAKITTYYRKAIPLTPGTTYVISFDYFAPKGVEGLRLWSGTMGFDNVYTSKGSNEWKKASKIFTTPADMALNTNWDLGIVCEGEGHESLVIDNLSVKLYNTGVAAQSITLSKQTMTLIPGRTGTLAAYATPADGDINQMTWTSSNDDVATVEYGVVTGVGKGTAIITGTTKSGAFASCTVTVSGNETYVQNGSFDTDNTTAWTYADGASKAEGVGVSNTNAAEIVKNSTVSQVINGTFKPETEYQLFVRYRTASGSKVGITLANGTEKLVDGKTGTSGFWKKATFDFKTGAEAPTSLTLTLSLAEGNGPVYVDNVILAQKASLVDLVVTDIIWDGGDSQVKPGDKLTFAATVTNQGEDKVKLDQSFDINFCLDGKTIATATYSGQLDAGDSTIVICESAWTAAGLGDHTISAHVNPKLSVLEIDDTNNTAQVNLRIANERLEAPEQALAAGMTNLIFSDDFDSDATIDKYATGDHGYKWYVTANWGNGTAKPEDYSVKDGILSLHRNGSPNNITLSTVDINTANGFTWNTGYLEYRLRIVDADGAQVHNVGNVPAIWSFPVGKHIEDPNDNSHYVEMDWMEYWGLDTGKWPTRPDGYYTISLHEVHKEQPDNWISNGGKSGRYQNGLGDEQWHVMGFRWEIGKLAAYLDGVKIFEQRWSVDAEPNPGVSSQAGFIEDPNGIFKKIDEQFNVLYLSGHKKNPLELDYVRIWQGDGSVVSPDDSVEDEEENGEDGTIDFAAEEFWYNYGTDIYGEIITEVNADNYLTILEGAEYWDLLSAERKAEINALFTENGQPTFDELIAAARAFAEGTTPDEDGDTPTEDEPAGDTSPETGVPSALPSALAAMALGAAALWLTKKRRAK